ncbi:LOW QUALITY PROTEIN: cytochrome P450 4C1-like [Diaphorina citri]|uniref:LOW QUALITY PROTEIN: cytochrome P450 4C1-like n=1 Tax=Diaphorina citri TaxID=121845 RepID=A0A3Q0IS75_DIACI|nr:LOW QUALITY PROTEIN: cytochrome P450 4C1-like [Diaphorina citri]
MGWIPHKIIRVWFGGELMVLVADPSVIAQVNTLTLTKTDVYQYLGDPYLKKGIFVDKDIPHWKASKKVITQVFVFKVLKQYIKIFHEESIILVNKLQELAYSGQPFYPPKYLELATFNSIMRTTLGVNPNHFQRKLFLPILRNNFVYSLFGWRQDEERNMGIVLDLAHTVLEDLKTDMKNTTDIMRESRTSLAELLLQQPDISMKEVEAQIVTVIGAGLDTSMIQNSMVLIMLATHPAVQEKVFEEMVQVLGEDINVLPSYEDLMKLEYLERVIKECLRMYPAAPFTGRKITEDIKVTTENGKEYIFPAGVAIGNLLYHVQKSPDYYENPRVFDPDRWLPENSVNRNPHCYIPFTISGVAIGNLLYHVQKSPDYYENPRVFDPDRWLPENSVNRNPHCYIPFSSGPRNCIGGKYAILQMKTIVSAILRKYKVLPSESCKTLRDVRVRMNLTMELKPQCQITLRNRKSE